ncbi:trypsin-like peptidase domain-containing protein [Streptomyces sp. Go-475]|uniref:trypsin-like peptidase domain-containing protein n=1 Tax=Streptomyces sp. Go-475 TaxID=2072505 RepID=UPI000DEEE2F4|nr:trypsin-like peptidase domain-containing protein [Streptomyces sp. Go-475]AXE88443.1 putative periplasmic serine endoprotease DegP-like precursor [Streptomyces sp. Go-475]
MNEGKPTKAKWWSRPRPQGPSAEPEGTDGPVAADPGAAETREQAAAPAAAADTDGDFELPRPAAPQQDDTGDYELRSPEAPATGETPAGASAAASVVESGVEAGPAAASVGESGTEVAPAAMSVVEAGVEAGSAAASAVESGTEAGSAAAEVGDGVPAPAPAAAAVPVDVGVKPLHDPDPYSTPPYGEPGPWAPAPPVQHPAATPTHGVAMPGQASVPGPPVAPVVPAQSSHVPAALEQAQAQAPAQVPVAPVHADVPPQGPAPDPWQRYDPWAAPAPPGGLAPLQQNGAAVPSTEQRRKRGRKALVGGAVLLALVSGGIGGALGTYLERNGGVGTVELPQAGKESTGRDAGSVAGIAGRALPSVVTLHVSGAGEQGTGTGFVLDTRGHILTNNHVVQPAGSGGEITVTFNGGETAQAELVGRDSGYDLAVVRVKGVRGLTPLPLGNSDNVQVGDPVVAIGAPFDLAGTVTSGIISAKERPITAGGEKGDGSDVSYVDALQTDAPINPGNSGGPLLDAKGRVIGINSAIRSAGSGSDLESGQSGSIGLGFAIPINQGKRVAEELINTGKATHPVIGITLDMDYGGDGARVAAQGSEGGPPVTAGGPGAQAGIKAGDVITEVDGQRVHSGEELIVKTRAHRPGDRLRLTLERGGEERTVSLVLGSSGGD